MHKKYELGSWLITCLGIFCVTGNLLHIGKMVISHPSCPQIIKPGQAALASLKSDLKESRKHKLSVRIA